MLQLQELGITPASTLLVIPDTRSALVVDSENDVDLQWDHFLRGEPDFLKAFLLFSERHIQRANDPAYDYQRGLDPRLLPYLVSKAHGSGLAVSVHVYSVSDFRVALESGADQIAHLPGVGYEPGMDVGNFLISDMDAKRAATHGVTVITTISSPTEEYGEEFLTNVAIPNLRMLKKHNVQIFIGSDLFRRTTDVEISYLIQTGVFTPIELLRMWSIDTPKSIFPSRKIGCFEEGWEASFLVLKENPLSDLTNALNIDLRVKQGKIIEPISYSFPSLD